MSKRSLPARPQTPERATSSASRAGEVRIIAGQWKRTRLRVLPRPGLRPTPDRVRETLFNWLGTDLSGWRVLDAFAGSGALGLEAASRGAAQVLLLDNDAHAVRELAAVHQRLHAPVGVRVERADALVWMARSAPQCFELVLLDPPFDSPLAAAALTMAQRLLVPGGLLVIEAPQYLSSPEPGIQLLRQMKAGAVHLQLFQVGGSDPAAIAERP